MEDKNNGSVTISDEVIASIVTTAAMEIEGVERVYQKIQPSTKGAVPGSKNSVRGIVIAKGSESVDLTVQLEVKLGYKIQEVAEAVQKRVSESVGNMTGLNVFHVNVVVISIADSAKNEGIQKA